MIWKSNFLLLVTFMIALSNAPQSEAQQADQVVRFATYNLSLYGKQAGEVASRLSDGNDRQAKNLASVIQTVRPDIILLNEIDFDADDKTLNLFADKYLAVDQENCSAMEYPFRYGVPTNTGLDSTIDIDNDGKLSGPNDAWGYGVYPGQYAMAVLSRYPIDQDAIRTFQQWKWSDTPNALRPVDPNTSKPYYDDTVWKLLRLSSKNHVDVPIAIGDSTVHLLASHPTPPVFDGPEDRNGCRNHDEIHFWIDYIDGGAGDYLVDDQGRRGGLKTSDSFVIVGDLNADANRGDGKQDAIERLQSHPRLSDPAPTHALPAIESAGKTVVSDSITTAAFNGGMRVDYCLPSAQWKVSDSGVFWPAPQDSRSKWIRASDHRLVWVDVTIEKDGEQ
ncbi:Endonuclease/Exonuclease/phosphatase family protein [Planctomycetes bacterium CA13]|uniref:Endonuclease/Exonuclease/phosphatase family protein n=1 Tax=Novipirellula herctigrandis TaxID=2527986 RepID=A0A5C5Z010_9BACT|nr:Endonuclease/Exonuclease/phosphatase family protein [Planctomycetes bacterium CA13]